MEALSVLTAHRSWPRAIASQGLAGKHASAARSKGRLLHVYPTAANVRGSFLGYAGGGSIPNHIKCDSRCAGLSPRVSNCPKDILTLLPATRYKDAHAHLLSKLHKWKASWCGRDLAMPHIKTFLYDLCPRNAPVPV